MHMVLFFAVYMRAHFHPAVRFPLSLSLHTEILVLQHSLPTTSPDIAQIVSSVGVTQNPFSEKSQASNWHDSPVPRVAAYSASPI